MSYSLTFFDAYEGPASFADLLAADADEPVNERVAGFVASITRRWPPDNELWRGPIAAHGAIVEMSLDADRLAHVGNALIDMADRAGLARFDPQLPAVFPPTLLRPTWDGSRWQVRYPDQELLPLGELEMTFFSGHAADEYVRVGALLEALRDHLPLALPVTHDSGGRNSRFSWSERFLFRDAARSGRVHWKATAPVAGGGLYGIRGNGRDRPDQLVRLHIMIDVRSLGQPALRAKLADAVPAIAHSFGAFYVVGAVPMRLMITGPVPRYVRGPGTPEQSAYTTQWLGLPSGHVLLEWFGPPYLPYLSTALTAHATPACGGLYATYYQDTDERARDIPPELIAGSSGKALAITLPSLA